MPKTSTHQLLSHQAVKRLNVYPSPLWIHGRWSPGWCPGPPLFPKDAESTEKPETSRNLAGTPSVQNIGCYVAPCFSLMATLDVYPWGLDNETQGWKISKGSHKLSAAARSLGRVHVEMIEESQQDRGVRSKASPNQPGQRTKEYHGVSKHWKVVPPKTISFRGVHVWSLLEFHFDWQLWNALKYTAEMKTGKVGAVQKFGKLDETPQPWRPKSSPASAVGSLAQSLVPLSSAWCHGWDGPKSTLNAGKNKIPAACSSKKYMIYHDLSSNNP